MEHFNYITTNKINGKQYIGAHSSNDIINDKYLGAGKLINQAIKKYGKENFTRNILNRTTTTKETFYNEKFLIEMYNTLAPNGYNLSPTGGTNVPGCSFHSEETKKQMSESTKGNTNVRGRKHVYNKKLDDEKLVKKEELLQYLEIGYKLGRRPFSEEHIKNMTKSQIEYLWVYNKKLNKEKQIKKREKFYYLKREYELGRRPFTEEHIKNLNIATNEERIYIYKENKKKRIKKEEKQKYLGNNWKLKINKSKLENVDGSS